VKEFYARLFHQHAGGHFNPILHAGLVGQEMAVDAGAVVENERLSFYRNNQAKLRANLY